jgi:hypothetical protein
MVVETGILDEDNNYGKKKIISQSAGFEPALPEGI